MKKKIVILVMILLTLLFSGCNKTIVVPCLYPILKTVPQPKEITINGFGNCKAKVKDEWVGIGKCIDFKNIIFLKGQNSKLKRVIEAYEKKIKIYNNMYIETNTTKVK